MERQKENQNNYMVFIYTIVCSGFFIFKKISGVYLLFFFIRIKMSEGKLIIIKSDDDLLMSRSTDKGRIWKELNFLNSNAINDSGDDLNPHLITNKNGKWVNVCRST
jgi:hypothetical protein